MKNKLHLFTSVIITVLLMSCSGGNNVSEVKLIPVKSGSDYEYIDQEGKIVINPQFGEASVFRNGIALVQTSGENPKWGYITEDGKYSVAANYKEATIFSEDLAWVVSENGAPTAINSKGEIKITLQDAESVRIYKEGLAAYSVESDSGLRWGFVDKEGKVKINPQFLSTGNYSNGKCAVANNDGKWGYIDSEGKILINYQFDGAEKFINGRAVVRSGAKAGVIDENGKYIINPQFSGMSNDGNNFLIVQDGKFGWCDKEGKITINPQFSNAYLFLGNGLAPVKSGGSWGYIDKEGKIAINPQFEEATPFNGKLALVLSSDKIGFIDKEGKYVINPQFDEISNDFINYLINGSSRYESVETDYFNIGAITDRIKKDITDKTVANISFITPISQILKKNSKSTDDVSKDGYGCKLVESEKMTKDATLDFVVYGSFWRGLDYDYNYNRYNYSFNGSETPIRFEYTINLSGKGYIKIDEILKALVESSFSDFTKDTELSSDSDIYLKNSSLMINIWKSEYKIIIRITSANNNSQDENTGGDAEGPVNIN